MDSVATKTRVLEMLNENTIQMVYFDDVVIEENDMEENFVVYDKFTLGKKLKRLIIGGNYTEITSEALKYSREETKKRKGFILADAVVVQSLAQRLLANFYFSILKPGYPTKVFNDIEKAKVWLVSKEIKKEISQC